MSQVDTNITPGFEDWANHMGLATKKDLNNSTSTENSNNQVI